MDLNIVVRRNKKARGMWTEKVEREEKVVKSSLVPNWICRVEWRQDLEAYK